MERSALVIPLIGQSIRTREYLGFENGEHTFLLNDNKLLCKGDNSLREITTEKVEKDSEYRKKLSWKERVNLAKEERVTVSALSNSEKVKTTIFSVVEKNTYKHSIVTVINEEEDVLWKVEIAPDFDNEKFGFIDAAVTNDGNTVYLLAKSHSTVKKRYNHKLHFLKIDDSGVVDNVSENIPDANYKDVKMKVLSNGNLFVGGYRYEQKSKKETVLKSFAYVLNPQNLETLNEQIFDYSKFIPHGEKHPYLYYNGYYRLNIRDVYETSDGKITMLAEESYQLNSYRNGVLYRVEYIFSNIFVDSYHLSGEPENSSILYKYQTIFSKSEYPQNALPLSFDVLPMGDKLMLVYNDDVNNLQDNTVRRKSFDLGKYKTRVAATVCAIENGETGRKKALINSKDENRFFLKVLKSYENEAIVFTQAENFTTGALMVEKITWE
jgi:hypothetical protein